MRELTIAPDVRRLLDERQLEIVDHETHHHDITCCRCGETVADSVGLVVAEDAHEHATHAYAHPACLPSGHYRVRGSTVGDLLAMSHADHRGRHRAAYSLIRDDGLDFFWPYMLIEPGLTIHRLGSDPAEELAQLLGLQPVSAETLEDVDPPDVECTRFIAHGTSLILAYGSDEDSTFQTSPTRFKLDDWHDNGNHKRACVVVGRFGLRDATRWRADAVVSGGGCWAGLVPIIHVEDQLDRQAA